MFNKILIANRGEIACRVIKTARMLGVRTVSVYSDADVHSQHVKLADEAYHIGPAPVTESYLQADKIIEVAKQSGAEAIHPGYGFLSENAAFAKRCEEANIVFIGPSASAIEAMGSKSSAKAIMAAADVPMVPGYYGDDQSLSTLVKEANIIGYPVLIKACAGGGGKGMRIVESESDFEAALDSCKRESSTAFGYDKVLLEKYLTTPRHIEIQIFLDQQGNAVHLFERDCSVQRRYQKVIEEAPAPNLNESLRSTMGQVAIQAAKAINYQGAGTVEFLYDEGEFYFMEMNTRLQVEHPITEMISGVDLVEWQLIVASGSSLPKQQDEITINGHAFEVRLYAEDPAQNFLPSTGVIEHLSTPLTNSHVRIDSGITQGDEVSIYYDPMIAKLIVWDSNRDRALSRLVGALSDYQVVGVETNLSYTKAIALHPEFQGGAYSTAFIADNGDDLLTDANINELDYVLAALYLVCSNINQRTSHAVRSNQSQSPWYNLQGWQNNLNTFIDFYFQESANKNQSDHITKVSVNYQKAQFVALVNEQTYQASATLTDNNLRVNLADQKLSIDVIESGQGLHLFNHGRYVKLDQFQPGHEIDSDSHSTQIIAPMHGSVTAIHVATNDHVSAGQKLVTMEAMKMEHVISAPYSGKIESIRCAVGDIVEDGLELVTFTDEDE